MATSGEYYECKGPKLALCISMEKYAHNERHGGPVDRARMESLFRTLDFQVTSLVDEKAEELKQILKTTAASICNETSCFVCFVSAHGNTDDRGHYISDCTLKKKVYIIRDILEPFMMCDTLKGIPKVFFINCCRGDDPKKPDGSTENLVKYLKESGKDSLVFFATEEGYKSRRYHKSGTLFGEALHEAIVLNHKEKDLEAIVTIANRMVRKNSEMRFREGRKKVSIDSKKVEPTCQVAPSQSTLTRKLYWRTRDSSESSADQEKDVQNAIFGQASHQENLKKWLISRQTKGTASIESQSFWISGMGGIGKTTLAKSLYEDDEIKDYYEHRVYWVTIKKNPGIVKCQRRLILEISKETPSARLDTEKSLLEELKKKLSKMRRVLLFLDDVWEMEHVAGLLGDPCSNALPPGSKCIITCRNAAALAKQLGKNLQIEKLEALNDEDAKHLFCSMAFSKVTVPANIIVEPLNDVVEDVIAACGNLPILLKSVGADLWGIRLIEIWEEIRNRLKHLPAINESDNDSAKMKKMIALLMISYDDLPEDTESGNGINFKDYFLDFAAFPEREEIEIAVLMDMWTKPGLTEDGAYRILEELEQRCLVEIDGYWCHMHDLFRALAVSIVEKPPLQKRKRLFSWGMDGSRLPGARNSGPKQVAFETEKMVIARSDLKAIHPTEAVLFTRLTRLRMLILTSNLNLVGLPQEIKCLTSLEKLDLSWCLGLRQLPREIGQLENLQKLNMAGCCSLTSIPRELGKLKKLLELNMLSCGLVELPVEIGDLTSLTFLCLNDCNQLKVLPEELGKLSNLERLECDMLEIREIPKTFGDLSKLTHISFSACPNITEIPAEFVKLRRLISMCFAISQRLKVVPVDLDDLVTQGSLTEFNVCDTAVMIDELRPSLRELQERFKSNGRDSNDESGGETKLYGTRKRGVLVNPNSVFDPRNKVERRASFGLARIITMIKTEPFLSDRFDAAVRIMYTMANHVGARHAIVRFGGLPVLLRCIDKGHPDRCGTYAAATLIKICMTYSTHKAVVDARGLEILTRVLRRKNHIRFQAYEALLLITNGDINEGDHAFTTEIYDRCGHVFGVTNGVSECKKEHTRSRSSDLHCCHCKVGAELLQGV